MTWRRGARGNNPPTQDGVIHVAVLFQGYFGNMAEHALCGVQPSAKPILLYGPAPQGKAATDLSSVSCDQCRLLGYFALANKFRMNTDPKTFRRFLRKSIAESV